MLLLLAETLTPVISRLQRAHLPDAARDHGRADRARHLAAARTGPDPSPDAPADRADGSRRRSPVPSAEGRYADHGRHADPRRHSGQHLAVGRPAQSLRLDRALALPWPLACSVLPTTTASSMLRNPKGLSAREKLFWQSLVADRRGCDPVPERPMRRSATALLIPYLKDVLIPLGWVFVPFVYLVIVGTSNAVNLTDGLDGLAIMPTVLVGGALGMFAWVAGNAIFSRYLGIPYVAGAGELLVILRGDSRRRPGIPVVQHLPGAGLHGRHRRAVARWSAGNGGRHRAPGSSAADHGRHLRRRDRVGNDAGGLVQDDRQAHLPHGAAAPPLRAEGLGGTAR